MDRSLHRLLPHLALALAAAGLTLSSAMAGDEIGHEEARRLVEQGKIKPLESLLATLAEKVPGKLLKSELENEKGRLLYEFKVLRPDGRVQEVEFDAATGNLLKIEDDD